MDFCKAIIGRSLNEIKLADVEAYFQIPRKEDYQQEFKSIRDGNIESSINGVLEAIASFLNTNGGLVIWGAPEESKDGTYSGSLTPGNWKTDKDGLVKKLSSKISPMPREIRLELVGQIVVIEVDPSDNQPHQVEKTGKYLMRLDGQKAAMPHNMVEALIKAAKFPVLNAFLRIDSIHAGSNHQGGVYVIDLTVAVFNKSFFRNEEDLKMRLLTSIGAFQYNDSIPNMWKYETSIIHQGAPIHVRNKLVILQDDFNKAHDELLLTLTISGRHSPMRMSTFRLSLSNNFSSPTTDKKGVIVVRKDNVLLKDVQDEMNKTDESAIEDFLEGKIG